MGNSAKGFCDGEAMAAQGFREQAGGKPFLSADFRITVQLLRNIPQLRQ